MSTHISTTVQKYPKLPYNKIKKTILGDHYELSLVFVGRRRAQTLNKRYRKKTYTPNVLSFPLTKDRGEIFIAPEVALSEAKKYHMTKNGYVGYLFIHGLLHLKGHHHGATMEKAEKKYLSKYALQ